MILENHDTISTHIVQINERLSSIEDKIILDDWFKVLVILVPIIVGIITLILTRNKEVRFKKAEVGGEIFMRIHELRNLRTEYFHAFINRCAYTAAAKLTYDQQREDEFLRQTYGIISGDEPEQIKQKIEVLAKELIKYIGQFRFYLRKKKSKQLNQMSFVIHVNHVSYQFFENCKTQLEIFDEHEKLFLNRIFNDEQEKKINELFGKLEELLIK